MQCPKCNSDIQAGDKFCRECGAKIPSVCPQCSHELSSKDKFCPECGTKITDTTSPTQTTVSIPKLEDMHSQLQSLIPDILAQKYLTAEQQITAGENRPITALFADISGFTPLSATKSSEAIFHLVQDCFKQLVSIVAKYEGSISGFRGDGLLALFGAPILHENDAERAILAAIDMREAIKDHQLQVSIGINTAMMTVGEIQTQLHNEYTAYGNDINLAKRLQESATPGQILVGAGSYRLTRRAFDFEIISDLIMKGFTQPVTAYSVQQVKTHPEKLRGIEGLRAKMIGREHEFAEVKDSVDEWLSGHGQIVSVIGEAGIGKSRLVSELKTYLSSKDDKQFQYIEGRCVSIGQPISYWPFIDILKTYFNLGEGDDTAIIASKVIEGTKQIFPNSADETLPLLGQLLSIKYSNELDDRLKFATPEQIRHQTLMQLRDLFEALARTKPLLLILEDLHWADEFSLNLISLLMDELTHTPLMLLCVYRPEKEHQVSHLSDQAQRKCLDKYTEITLRKLSTIESRQLVEELLTIDNLPENVKNMILDKSEGNPFFIEEVIRSLIDRDLVYRDEDRWKARDELSSIDVPDTIQSVVLSRVDRLQAEAKYVLQCASVIGRLFKYRLLEHLAQQERNLNTYLNEFEERDLVYKERTMPELEYAFKHALTQESTYQGILEKGRKAFHSQVALGIEMIYQERLEDYYEELAHHYSRSDNAEKAIEYMLKAGEKAKRNYANDTAVSYYQMALDMLKKYNITRNDWKLEALKGIGEIYLLVGKLVESGNAFEDAIKLAIEMKIPSHNLVRLYSQLSNILWWQSRFDEAIHYAEIGLEILGDDTECLEAALMNSSIAAVSTRKGNFVKYRDYTRKNMAFIKKIPYSVELVPAYTHIVIVYNWDNDSDSALEWAKELERQATNHNHLAGIVEAWFSQCSILMSKGNYKESFTLIQKNLELCKRIGDIKYASLCHWTILDTLFTQGNIEEAWMSACESLKIAEKVGIPKHIGIIHQQLGSISMCQRLWDKAIYHYQKFDEIEQDIVRNPLMIPITKISLGHAYMKKGDYDKAIEIFYEYVNKVFELQDKWNAQHRLFELLNKLEYVYRSLGKHNEFLNFCKDYREQHTARLNELPLQQWCLEPAQINNELSNLTFGDDFSTGTLDSSWNWFDTFNDCHYNVDENGLGISAINGRGLARENTSAPRLMIGASGDFAVQVCISPATKDKPQIGGLLIWKDDKNYICLERGRNDIYGLSFYGYISKNDSQLYESIYKEDQIAGRGFLPEESEFTYLRLERIGNEISAYCSIDNENWLTCGKITLPMEDPIQVGIHAIGMIDRTIYCGEYKEGTATLFRNFRIWTKE